MKITIDTQQDKPEEIRKMCQFLLDLANNSTSTNSNAYLNTSSTPSVDTSSMMNMFGDDNSIPQASIQTSMTQTPDRAPDFGAFLSLTKNYERKESTTRPQIEFL